jgi:A/G-specific adenine glycosylase
VPVPAAPDPASAAAFRGDLLAWYRSHRRVLPWRSEPSVYRTVVSEFMLQQTQVKTVLPYFARWMEALPDFASLAAAPEERVLRLWEGLGYYTRARNLLRLARALAALPAQPRDLEGWLALPGVGPYSAAAITSIAFGTPVACVDGNVVRILARITGDATEYRDSASASRAFQPLAQALLTRESPGDHNQAMMELGATVCHRRKPLCLTCPVRRHCAAARSGDAEAYPRLKAKVIERREVARVWIVRERGLLLHRAPAGAKRFAGLHELPTAEHLGLQGSRLPQPALLTRRRGITRYAITESIHAAPDGLTPEPAGADLVWVPLDRLETVTFSGPHRRWVTELVTRSANA